MIPNLGTFSFAEVFIEKLHVWDEGHSSFQANQDQDKSGSFLRAIPIRHSGDTDH